MHKNLRVKSDNDWISVSLGRRLHGAGTAFGCCHKSPAWNAFSTLFHAASALSAPSGHLPLEGKAIHSKRRSRHHHFSFLISHESRDEQLVTGDWWLRSSFKRSENLCFGNTRETLIKSLSDFTLEFLCIARNNLTRIAGYLRKAMTKLCIKILVKADSAIESAFPYIIRLPLLLVYWASAISSTAKRNKVWYVTALVEIIPRSHRKIRHMAALLMTIPETAKVSCLLVSCLTPPKKAMWNNDHLIFAFHLPRGTCSSHRSDRETLSQLSFMP